MGTTTSLVSVEEYLKTSTDPDCEYVAGRLEERSVGEYDHSTWQGLIAGYFLVREKEPDIVVEPVFR